jgi:hypothetical protein
MVECPQLENDESIDLHAVLRQHELSRLTLLHLEKKLPRVLAESFVGRLHGS